MLYDCKFLSVFAWLYIFPVFLYSSFIATESIGVLLDDYPRLRLD